METSGRLAWSPWSDVGEGEGDGDGDDDGDGDGDGEAQRAVADGQSRRSNAMVTMRRQIC